MIGFAKWRFANKEIGFKKWYELFDCESFDQ